MFRRVPHLILLVLAGASVCLAPGPALSPARAAEPFAADARELVTRTSLIDPEILSPEGLLAAQDQHGDIWLHRLDPVTGLPVAGQAGRKAASGALPLRQSYNGPEFGRDASGWSLFFTGSHAGQPQIWRIRPHAGGMQAAPVFTDGQRRQSVLASKHPASSSIRLLYLRGSLAGGLWHWVDPAAPLRETPALALEGVDSPRWVDGAHRHVQVPPDGPDAGQVQLVDTDTGEVRTITGDAGKKSFAYGWQAPEHGGATLVLALVDGTSLAVWRDAGERHWRRVATLHPPAGSRHRQFGSPEPFTASGQSYISLVLKSDASRGAFRDGEVWIMGLNGFARRVDDAGGERMRFDPETFRGRDEVFVYYNVLTPGQGVSLYRSRAGLRP